MSTKELETAIDAVVGACRLCTSVQASLVTEETVAKKDKSPVTVADFGAQALVSWRLKQAFPNDPLVGEESASVLRGEDGDLLRKRVVEQVRACQGSLSDADVLDAIDRGKDAGGANGRFWTLDPIDGTKGFLRGDQYAVALALIENGEVVLGVLGCPSLPQDANTPDGPKGCIFSAAKGQGATMRLIDGGATQPVRVTDLADVTQARFCESVESGHSSHDDSAKIAERLGVKADPFRIDSQCKYAAVARGDASIYLRLPTRADYEEKIWDHGAGWCVVTEAGGRVSDVRGEPLDFSLGRTLKNNKGVIVTNGKLHDEVIAAVRAVLGV